MTTTRKPAAASGGVGDLLTAGSLSDPELNAIKLAWDKNTGSGREEEQTRELARAYVTAHPERFHDVAPMTLEEAVQAVETFRTAGFENQQWLVETWLLAKVPPQEIGGSIALPVDVPLKELETDG